MFRRAQVGSLEVPRRLSRDSRFARATTHHVQAKHKAHFALRQRAMKAFGTMPAHERYHLARVWTYSKLTAGQPLCTRGERSQPPALHIVDAVMGATMPAAFQNSCVVHPGTVAKCHAV